MLQRRGVSVHPWIAVAACLVFCASHVAEAAYFIVPKSLESRVRATELVVSGRVRKKEEFSYMENGELVPCGITYSIEVLNTYRGRTPRNIQFSVYQLSTHIAFHKVNVGDDLLLLLHTDYGRPDPAPNEFSDLVFGTPSFEKAKCLVKLALLRLDPDDGAFPLIHEPDGRGQMTTWLAYSKSRTTLADIAEQRPYANDCRGQMCDQDGRRLASWTEVEARIKEWVLGGR